MKKVSSFFLNLSLTSSYNKVFLRYACDFLQIYHTVNQSTPDEIAETKYTQKLTSLISLYVADQEWSEATIIAKQLIHYSHTKESIIRYVKVCEGLVLSFFVHS